MKLARKPAQKLKLTSILLLFYTLLLSTLPLPATAAKPTVAIAADPKPVEAEVKLDAAEDYGKLPLSFEANVGQSSDAVRFLSRGKGYTVFLTSTEAVLSLRGDDNGDNKTTSSVLRMNFVGANRDARIEGEQQLPGKVNYLIGNDRTKWRTGIATFQRVHYDEIWQGIDLVWYGTQTEMEYDFVVKPGSEVDRIRLGFQGVDKLRINETGDLILASNGEEVVQSAPAIYQEQDQGRVAVSGKYVVRSPHEVGFEVGDYDRSKPLVIDPVLIYSSYIGGDSSDQGFAIAADSAGNAYIAGESSSSEVTFPLANPIQGTQNNTLAFITKLNAAGTAVVYSTFLGDATGFCTQDVCGTEVRGIAVNGTGRASITGATVNDNNDSDFPVTSNAFQRNGFCIGVCGLELDRRVDAFVSVLSEGGDSLVYSTFFGGGATASGFGGRAFDAGNALTIDSTNRIYITGQTASNNLPTKHAFQWSRHSEWDGTDAFIAVFNPLATNGNDTLIYSSYYGGDGDEIGRGVAVDLDRNAYIVGSTASTDLETKSPASVPFRATFQGGGFDGFVAKIDTEADGNVADLQHVLRRKHQRSR